MPRVVDYGPKQGKQFPALLRASDISEPITLTVKACEARDIKGVEKPVVTFVEIEKQWIVNKTNMAALAKKYGDIDLSELVGKKMILAKVPTTYQGSQTEGIRIVG